MLGPEGVLTGDYGGLFGVLSVEYDLLCYWKDAVCLDCGFAEISSPTKEFWRFSKEKAYLTNCRFP